MFGLVRPCCVILCVTLVLLAGCSRRHKPVAVAALPDSWQKTFSFDRMDLDKTPLYFATDQTHGGRPAAWLVKLDLRAASGRKVLAQVSTDATKDRYPLCISKDFVARDVAASVRFKAMTGKVDQAGGLVIRCLDKDNYYVTRANALENNVRFYKVEKGERIQLADAKVEVTPRQWHTLEIKAQADTFDIYYDGRPVIHVEDKTFDEPGRAGLWTKADSVTFFDDFKLRQISDR
jgi:hypothetical protein